MGFANRAPLTNVSGTVGIAGDVPIVGVVGGQPVPSQHLSSSLSSGSLTSSPEVLAVTPDASVRALIVSSGFSGTLRPFGNRLTVIGATTGSTYMPSSAPQVWNTGYGRWVVPVTPEAEPGGFLVDLVTGASGLTPLTYSIVGDPEPDNWERFGPYLPETVYPVGGSLSAFSTSVLAGATWNPGLTDPTPFGNIYRFHTWSVYGLGSTGAAILQSGTGNDKAAAGPVAGGGPLHGLLMAGCQVYNGSSNTIRASVTYDEIVLPQVPYFTA